MGHAVTHRLTYRNWWSFRRLSRQGRYAHSPTTSEPDKRTPNRRTPELLLIGLLCVSCTTPPQTYDEQIAASRAEKDAAFKSTSDSPIPAGERAGFQGLVYFDVDPLFRVPAALAETPMSTQIIEMDTTDGNRERMRVIGKLEFTLAGERRSLTAFVPERAQTAERLFVPFRDATNRGETYGGGRYLDLQRSSTGLYDLDFNRAYNPFCVYDAQYVCPLPPRENALPIAIRAGEQMPRGTIVSFGGSGVRRFGSSRVRFGRVRARESDRRRVPRHEAPQANLRTSEPPNLRTTGS